MKDLRAFYTKWLMSVALMIGLGTHFLSTVAIPALEQAFPQRHWITMLVSPIVSRPALVVIIAGAEWLIRKKLWRWRWFHPELDFSGTWDGVSPRRAD